MAIGERAEAQGQGAASENEEYLRLKSEHSRLDQRLHALESVRYPTPEEEQEIKTLKKQKLALKDRMEQVLKNP